MDLGHCEFTRTIAEQHCNTGESDCRWYHGNWELLKTLGIVSTSGVHAAEIAALLELALADKFPNPRILLSGSTDATILELAASTCSDYGHPAEFTAVDICETPLELMRRYANENMLTFTSVRKDILQYRPEERFDIILTHAFMGNFDDAARVRLVRNWYSMLKDGGCVVTVQRVRPAGSPSIVRFSVEQSRAFVDAALTAARAEKLPSAALARVEAAATGFTEHFMSHAINSKASLEQLFRDAEFTFRHLQYHSLENRATIQGPSVPSGGEYAFIIAERKNAE